MYKDFILDFKIINIAFENPIYTYFNLFYTSEVYMNYYVSEIDMKELHTALKKLTTQGYTCYISKPGRCPDGIIVTPSNNVLYVERSAQYNWGWEISLRCLPSQHGVACYGLPEPVEELNLHEVKRAETACLQLAKRIGAKPYSSDEFFKATNKIRGYFTKVRRPKN